MKLRLPVLLVLLFCISCATYYQVNYKFNQYFEAGELEKAEKALSNNKKAGEGKSRLLYFLNRGVVNSIQGNYDTSNYFLEQAYIIGEDLRKNYLNEAIALLSNSLFTTYKGEDHELLLLHYYKAMNFLKMGKTQEALVECRRMNIKLNQLSDNYRNNVFEGTKKYQRDAFVHTLMGIIYDADGDYNNAFIAYRNAVKIYEEDYISLFDINIPEQLKKDLLRTAYLSGFKEELQFFENKFGMDYQHHPKGGGELVFFWNNGLGPVKSEWSINFVMVKGEGGLVHFRNRDLGLNFPFQLEDENAYEEKGLDDLSIIRVAFPKYVERPLKYNKGEIQVNNNTYQLQKAENINAIAFRSLQQRMLREFSTALLRVALKKAAEHQIRKQSEGAGAALSIVNAITEKADTRNWQTLPHTIYYQRLTLQPGEHSVQLRIYNNNNKDQQVHPLKIDIREGQTKFHTFHSMETSSKNYNFYNYGSF